jgi:hypothetical protein
MNGCFFIILLHGVPFVWLLNALGRISFAIIQEDFHGRNFYLQQNLLFWG